MQTPAASQSSTLNEQVSDTSTNQGGSNRVGSRENGREQVQEEKIFDRLSEFIRSRVYSEYQDELIEIIST